MPFISNAALNVHVAGSTELVRFAAAAAILDISDIAQCPEHDKSSSILQLIKEKLKDLQLFQWNKDLFV